MATRQRESVTGGAAVRPQPGSLAPRLKTLDGVRLGLLSTGKRNCDELLAEIASVLGETYRFADVKSWRKSSVYMVAPQRKLDEIVEQCDAVIAGLGD